MKNRDLLKFVKKDGWQYDYSTGGHDHYTHPTKSGKVTFCGHPSDEVAPHTNQYSETGRFAMTKEYPVVYEWAGKNFAGYAPDVAGCMATAKTLPLIRSALKGALEAHLQWMNDDGDAIPEPSETVTVDMEPDAEYPQPRGYHVIVERVGLKMPRSKSTKPNFINSLVQPKRATAKRRVLTAA